MQIAKNKIVTIDYTLTDDEGVVMDSSKGGEPLAYVHGIGNIIPGLEAALEGKNPGDAFKVTIPPAEAYGERDEELVRVVSRHVFADVDDLEVGMQFQGRSGEHVREFAVAAIDGDDVTIDGNHPLAGVTLNFDVTVVGVRNATAEELSHGHVHGPDGHGH